MIHDSFFHHSQVLIMTEPPSHVAPDEDDEDANEHNEPLLQAAKAGNVTGIRELLDAGADAFYQVCCVPGVYTGVLGQGWNGSSVSHGGHPRLWIIFGLVVTGT